MFAYNKNYQEYQKMGQYNGFEKISNSGDSDIAKYKVFTLDFVFKKIIDYGEDQAEGRIRQCAQWKLKTSENFLRSLLKNGMDKIAW